MVKVLVTGGAGFIGSNLCRILSSKGHEVTAFDNLYLGRESNLSEGVRFVKGDVNKIEDLRQAGDAFDYVVHLAASSSAPMFLDDLHYAFENNICGHIRAMEFAKEVSAKKFLFASTSSIYGNNPTPLTEDQSVVPPNYYSVTKYAQEGVSRSFANLNGLEIVAFRFMSIYGLNEDHKGNFANLVSQFIWMMRRGEEPTLYGDGTQERDFTNVKDVCQGIEKAMLNEKKYGFTVFNIGTATAINLIDLVALINKVMGTSVPAKCIPNPVREGYVKTQLASLEKIKAELGYEPTVSLEEGIREIVENLTKRGDDKADFIKRNLG